MFVYVIVTTSGRSKIGVSKAPEKRLSDIQVGNHERASIWATFLCDRKDVWTIERAAHIFLKDFRTSGEWFSAHPDLAASTVGHFATGVPSLDHLTAMVEYVHHSDLGKRFPKREEHWESLKAVFPLFDDKPGIIMKDPWFWIGG
jgi:hypothetical protein